MSDNILLNSTHLSVGEQMEPNTIEFRESRKEILTIHADGRITVSEDCKPTETAAEVLRIMRDQWLSDIQCAKIRELQERIEALNRGNAAAERILCELTGCESGRDVPDWIVAAKDRMRLLLAERDTARLQANQNYKLREEFRELLGTDDVKRGVAVVRGLQERIKRLENDMCEIAYAASHPLGAGQSLTLGKIESIALKAKEAKP